MIQQTLRLFSLIAIMLLGISTPATAATEYWLNMPWGVYIPTNSTGMCFLMTKDEANSGGNLFSGIYLSNETGAILSFSSEDWDIKEEKITGMSVSVLSQNDQWTTYQGGEWSRTDAETLTIPIEDAFLDNYAAGNRLVLLRDRSDGSDPVIAGIVDLSGSATAISKLRNCVRDTSERIRREAEHERTHPSNPF